jgi:hypothetical protein
MKQVFILVGVLLIAFKSHSQIRIGVDTTRKPMGHSLKSHSKKYHATTPTNDSKQDKYKMPIKKTSGSMPNVSIDTTMKMPNGIK